MIKPEIIDFAIEERKHDSIQLTLNGTPFKKQPFADIGLYYKWKCPTPCKVCQKHPHSMECFDWGANILWKRYEKNPEEAKDKVTEMCYWNMKEKFDSWFVLGTHSRYLTKWMIVGILWMKKN